MTIEQFAAKYESAHTCGCWIVYGVGYFPTLLAALQAMIALGITQGVLYKSM